MKYSQVTESLRYDGDHSTSPHTHTHTHTHSHTLTHTHKSTVFIISDIIKGQGHCRHTHTLSHTHTHTHTHSHTHTGELAPQETQREGFCDVIGRGGLDAGKRQTRNTHSFTGEVHCFHASETHTHKHI